MSLGIYFAGSMRGGRDDADIYKKIIGHLREYGTIFTEHVGSMAKEDMDDKSIHDRDIEWLKKSDVLVAEVTQVSLGVGYEIGRAVAMDKKILCLYRPGCGKRVQPFIYMFTSNEADNVIRVYGTSRASLISMETELSAMIGGAESKNVLIRYYQVEEIEGILKDFFSQTK